MKTQLVITCSPHVSLSCASTVHVFSFQLFLCFMTHGNCGSCFISSICSLVVPVTCFPMSTCLSPHVCHVSFSCIVCVSFAVGESYVHACSCVFKPSSCLSSHHLVVLVSYLFCSINCIWVQTTCSQWIICDRIHNRNQDPSSCSPVS